MPLLLLRLPNKQVLAFLLMTLTKLNQRFQMRRWKVYPGGYLPHWHAVPYEGVAVVGKQQRT